MTPEQRQQILDVILVLDRIRHDLWETREPDALRTRERIGHAATILHRAVSIMNGSIRDDDTLG